MWPRMAATPGEEGPGDRTQRAHVPRRAKTYMRRCEKRGTGEGRGGPRHCSGWAVGLRQAEGVQARVGAQAAL